MIRVLIVDDSALMRKKLREMLMADRDIDVIATARDGLDGVNKARELRPDVVTMDINMPELDGLSALQYILADGICPVIVVSSLTQEGAMVTLEAMELGAFDYVAKPGGTISLNIAQTQRELIEKVKAAAGYADKPRLRGSRPSVVERVREPRMTTRSTRPVFERPSSPASLSSPSSPSSPSSESENASAPGNEESDFRFAVAIGISTGGPRTIMEVIPELPADLDAPVFLVQHMPAAFTAAFAERLSKSSNMPVVEASGGVTVRKNVVYLARGGQHMLLRKANAGKISLRLTTIPETLFVPSVDVMMDSVLNVFGRRTLGVLMTGMGSDGADAMVRVRKAGGYCIAESEETSVVWGMPKEAIERGGADIVLPSYRIAGEIIRKIGHWKKGA